MLPDPLMVFWGGKMPLEAAKSESLGNPTGRMHRNHQPTSTPGNVTEALDGFRQVSVFVRSGYLNFGKRTWLYETRGCL